MANVTVSHLVIGDAIKARRKERGFTLKELGEIVGLTHAALSKIENGKSEPSKQTLISLAKGLNDNFGELWLDEHIAGKDAPKSKKELAEEMSVSELISLKFGGKQTRRSRKEAEMLAKLLDAEVERIKREGW